VSALPAPVGDLLWGPSGRRRGHARLTLLALAVYLLFSAVCWLEVQLGMMQAAPAAWLCATSLVGISVFYGLVKVAVNRLSYSQGHDLAPFGGTAVTVTPGWMRSEMMLEAFRTTEDTWRSSFDPDLEGGPTAPPGFATSESPRYVGRAVAALAADPDRARWNQQSVEVGALADHYGFTDLDGSRPQAWRFMAAEEAGTEPAPDPADYR
jgi:NAD(P)-dependent dehydrogenase (short-subunit alcohol dehydrogenase family)